MTNQCVSEGPQSAIYRGHVVHHRSVARRDGGSPVSRTHRERQSPEKVASITVFGLYEAVPQLDVPEAHRHRSSVCWTHATRFRQTSKSCGKPGRFRVELRARGEEIDRENCPIGATALLADEPVITRNAGSPGSTASSSKRTERASPDMTGVLECESPRRAYVSQNPQVGLPPFVSKEPTE